MIPKWYDKSKLNEDLLIMLSLRLKDITVETCRNKHIFKPEKSQCKRLEGNFINCKTKPFYDGSLFT